MEPQTEKTVVMHLKALFVTMLAQIIVGVAIVILQILGHYIPELIQFLSQIGVGTVSAAQVYKSYS